MRELTINPRTFALVLTGQGEPLRAADIRGIAPPPCPHHCGRRIKVVWSDCSLPGEPEQFAPTIWACPSGCDVLHVAGRALARARNGWPFPAPPR